MLFRTNGYSHDIYGASLTLSDDHVLTDQEKCLVVSINMTAASKTVILGVADGDAMTVCNIGSNEFTVKNISGDTGVSLAANGMVTVIGGGDTADAAKFITGGGGGGGENAPLIATFTIGDNDVTCDKTYAQIAEAWNAGTPVYGQMNGESSMIPVTFVSSDDEVIKFELWTDPQYDGDSGELVVTYYGFTIEDGGGTNIISHSCDGYIFANVTSASSS